MRQNSGLIAGRELVRLGFTSTEIRGLIRHGALRRLHRGVYADGRAPLSDYALLKGSLLAFAGKDVWLSGRAASMGWNFEPVSIPNLEVTVVANATPCRRPRLTVRSVRVAPHPSELRTRNGLRISSVPRLLIEAAAQGATTDDLHRLIEQAVRRNLLDIPDLAATLARNLGHPGTAIAKTTCEEYLPHTDRKSGLERAFDRWLAKHPEIPAPHRNIHLGPWEIDCYWPEQGLALELDGRPYHTVVDDIERDNRKNTWLQASGKLILRVTDSRFKRDKPGVYRDLKAMLAVGAGDDASSAAAA
ncbi:MAG TPA: type IV toxin-antitoxin system AbiEi family antitoxin domain-containing protein [Solirubrobacteraceae bacterium]|nr:type IV toxin-antitoxin system AbiEi family antitoxin domain-containing protein [Solirubrobacteraceae bacterium]